MFKLRKRRTKLKNRTIFSLIFILVACIGIGNAYISWQLDLEAEVIARKDVWGVRATNLVSTDETIILDEEKVSATFTAKLNSVSDHYTFSFDVENKGSIDAMIRDITLTGLTEEEKEYINISIKYNSSDTYLSTKDGLKTNEKETIIVDVSYKNNSNITNGEYEITVDLDYERADDSVVIPNTIYHKVKTEYDRKNNVDIYTNDESSTFVKNVYYYTASANNNNIVFANTCWKMYRTTSTGGVKLLYNGKVDSNGKCSNERSNNIGYGSLTREYLPSEYYYSDDYSYDNTTGEYKLEGNKKKAKYDEETKDELIGFYTCKNSDEDSKCNQLYQLVRKDDSSNVHAYTYIVRNDLSYDVIAQTQFNYNSKSLASAGYMYNESYPTKELKMYETKNIVYKTNYSNNILFSESYDLQEDKYYLINPTKYENIQDVVGKYTFFSTNDTTTSNSIKYVISIDENSIYYVILEKSEYEEENYVVGSSFINNEDGTYTIENPEVIKQSEWNSKFESTIGKYVCLNNTDTCDNLSYIVNATQEKMYYEQQTTMIKYANSISYDEKNNIYSLEGESTSFADWHSNKDNIDNMHYTCLNSNGICEKVYYVTGYLENGREASTMYYIELTNGLDIGTALDKMLNDQEVNKIDSNVKTVVDKWYEENLVDYTNYIENTIYCNNRKPIEKSYNESQFNPNGGKLNKAMDFIPTDSLTCENETDKFSSTNNLAKLKYPVGLMTYDELKMIRTAENGYFTGTTEYWIMSASNASKDTIGAFSTTPAQNSISVSYGVRPVISVNGDIKLAGGEGTQENPFTLKLND